MRAPLVLATLAYAGGIAAGTRWPGPVPDGPFLLLVPVVGVALAGWWAAGTSRPPGRARPASDGRVILAALATAGLLSGGLAATAADRSCAAWLPPDTPVLVRGAVVEAVGDRLLIAADSVRLGGVALACRGMVAARWAAAGPAPGAAVTVRGRWWRPPGRAARLTPAGLFLVDSLVSGTGRGDGRGAVTAFRDRARSRVDRLFGDRAPLAASLLLAQRDGLDPDVRDRFARAGLSHLLAISGLHVGLVAGILILLAGAARLSKRGGAAAAGLGTAGYVAFLGAPHSATRAALQILLVLGARVAQRPARTEALIAAAALAILAVEPGALLGAGFQLSFAGVTGILVLRRPLLGAFGALGQVRVGGRRVGAWLADGLATSIAATVATAPIVAWHFGRVAPVGIVANLVAIPLLSAAVPALALALAVGFLWVPAGAFLATSGSALLDLLDATARVAADVPGGTVAVPASAAVAITGAVLVGYVATRRLGQTRPAVRGTVWVGVAGAVLMVAPLRPTGDALELHMIDVGQGDAVAIRSPAGRWLLVDAGLATDRYDAGARVVVPYLSARGVRRLAGLVVTHADADHMGGAPAVIEALRPGWVADPGMAAPKSGYLGVLRSAERAGVPWLAARTGTELELDGVTVAFLYPAGAVSSEDANDGSVVLRVTFGEFSALLTGDAPAAVEDSLVAWYGAGLEAEVLKVGHHGSATSTGAALLDAIDAELALISAGRGNRYGHPHRSVLARLDAAGVRVARTDRHGTIVVRGTAGGRVSVRVERGGLGPP